MYAPARRRLPPAILGGRSEMIDYCTAQAADHREQGLAVFHRRELLGFTHEAGKSNTTTSPWFVTPGMGALPKDANEGEVDGAI
ncbi:MAG: hypothetical protein U0792_04100 [Gemmataceae bacterium]